MKKVTGKPELEDNPRATLLPLHLSFSFANAIYELIPLPPPAGKNLTWLELSNIAFGEIYIQSVTQWTPPLEFCVFSGS